MGYNRQIVSNQPLNVDSQSSPQAVLDAGTYSIQLAFTGSVCSFSAALWTSSDSAQPQSAQPQNFDELPNSSVAITSAGTFTYNVGLIGYSWVKLVLTDNSGGTNNGTLSARINVID